MEPRTERRYLAWLVALFGVAFFMPVDNGRFLSAVHAALDLVRWYAREHVVLCLLPAFFIAGVIAVFVSQGAVVRYFGASARKWLAYTVAAVSGGVLAVCSCTILPLFTSIYKRGAGLGPAIAFLYSGPAISILSVILTTRVLGVEMGMARMVGAVGFALLIGLLMAFIFRNEEKGKEDARMEIPRQEGDSSVRRTVSLFFSLAAILVFANWGAPSHAESGMWGWVFASKWYVTGGIGCLLGWVLVRYLKISALEVLCGGALVAVSVFASKMFVRDAKLIPLVPMLVGVAVLSVLLLRDKGNGENREWLFASWGFAKQILPLLAVGVLSAGFLLGSTHDGANVAGVVPPEWIEACVGGNSLLSNFCASFLGAFMYFATLTEVPIVQGLLASGMGEGPALALLLAGPSLSLPNMLVLRGVMGTRKTAVYVALVVVMATVAGFVFGTFYG